MIDTLYDAAMPTPSPKRPILAVLAALNIADEMLTMQQRYDGMAGRLNQAETSVKSRADNLSGLLDRVLRAG